MELGDKDHQVGGRFLYIESFALIALGAAISHPLNDFGAV